MGDTGSLILGYIISLLVIHLSRVDTGIEVIGHSNMVLAFSTLIVPLFDVVRVVIHRIREKKNPFLPDKNHFHHKLLRTGMRPRGVMVFHTMHSFVLYPAELAAGRYSWNDMAVDNGYHIVDIVAIGNK